MKRPEQLLQQEVFSNLIPLMHLQKHKQFIAFQIRNETGIGGKQGAILGTIAKSMGTMAGVSDTAFLFPQTFRECVDYSRPTQSPSGVFYPLTRAKIPPKIVFVEFKAYVPLKTRELHPTELLNDDQVRFKKRVEEMGFEYRIIAAQNVDDAINQAYKFLRENNVSV